MTATNQTSTNFGLLGDGRRFRSVGKITGTPSQYVYEKVKLQRDERGVSFNAVAFKGEHREKKMFFYGDDRVVEEK